jgi:hypothetical protein
MDTDTKSQHPCESVLIRGKKLAHAAKTFTHSSGKSRQAALEGDAQALRSLVRLLGSTVPASQPAPSVFHPCSIAQGDDPILGQSSWQLIAEFVQWVLARADAARRTDAGRAEALFDDTPIEVFGPGFEGVKINY